MTVAGTLGPLNPAHEIHPMWSIFQIDDLAPISLRAISPKDVQGLPTINRTFPATKYPDVADRQAAFEAEALLLNALGYNCYTVMNPIDPAFLMGPVSDADIASRRLLLIDIDRVGGTSEPATDAEVDAAMALADQVEKYLDDEGWGKPTRVMSGNGVHLYYSLASLPNDDSSKHRVQRLLQILAGKFDNGAVCIDTSVFNAGRITKVPGTLARKGVESEGRHYRRALVL